MPPTATSRGWCRKGYRVAICEQVEDPKKAKGVVKREVVRVVSPGTLTDVNYLDEREPAFLMAVVATAATPARPAEYGVALVDLSTGEFDVAEYAGPEGLASLRAEIAVLRPREIVVAAGYDIRSVVPEIAQASIAITEIEGWHFELDAARQTLVDQLRVSGLEGFGLERHQAAVCAGGALVRHLRDTQKADLAHVRTVRLRQAADGLLIDPITLKHLEIVESIDGARAGSLLDEIDRTVTPMGCRLLRTWLLRPLTALEAIRDRLDAVEELAVRTTDRGKLRDTFKSIQDLERLIARIALSTAGPRDLLALGRSLGAVPRLAMVLSDCQAPLVRSLVGELDDLADVRQWIEEAIQDDPPALARDGGFVRDGLDQEIDDLRHISRSGKQVIAEMEDGERARTGISSLKVRFNRVFGYYIEISKSNLHAVPADYIRKQTIAGGERYITPALKDYEEKVLGADERIVTRELEIFEALRQRVSAEAARVLDTARAVAALDVLAGLAETATVCNYTKPHVHDGDEIVAVDVRHPVVERLAGGTFVPNDVHLDGSRHQLVILTGPEHGRQVHLPAAGGAALRARADRIVRAGARGQGRADRSAVRARRRVRQHRARPVHLHGGDAGDRAHPERRDLAQPRGARRDRARHRDLRRLEHCVGGGRVPGHQPARAAEDDVRHALPRADRPGRCPARRRQCPRRGARVERRHHLPAQDPAGPIRPELRHPGGEARGPAGVGDRAGPRHSRLAGAGRADARRQAGAERRAAGGAAAARAVPGRVAGGRETAREDPRDRHQSNDADRRPSDPAGVEELTRLVEFDA